MVIAFPQFKKYLSNQGLISDNIYIISTQRRDIWLMLQGEHLMSPVSKHGGQMIFEEGEL